ncbi:hypothetical protein ACN6MY_20175 [Peribacillus sp. B-H-3]|jgi:hypothetical protein|uniref:hypothetical protein n=1 Tax=Peribacillus sp. B-H-3 TaxID=3400420 RepID=UPI003B0111B5
MKFSEKGQVSLHGANQVAGVDFRDFTQKEQSGMEFSSEFGMNVRAVKKLKNKKGN